MAIEHDRDPSAGAGKAVNRTWEQMRDDKIRPRDDKDPDDTYASDDDEDDVAPDTDDIDMMNDPLDSERSSRGGPEVDDTFENTERQSPSGRRAPY